MTEQKNTNGGIYSEANPIQDKQIEFPVTYTLKVVVTLSQPEDYHKKELENILKKNDVLFRFLEAKRSSKGTYISFNLKITLSSKEQMDQLYNDLKSLQGIKFAV